MDELDQLRVLERLMVEHGACVRAIPRRIHDTVETRHANDPDLNKPNIVGKRIVYLERFKREMLVFDRIPEHAGMFLVETDVGTMSSVRFSGKRYFASLEEVIAAIRDGVETT